VCPMMTTSWTKRAYRFDLVCFFDPLLGQTMSNHLSEFHRPASELDVCDWPFFGIGSCYLSSQKFLLSGLVVLVKAPLRESCVIHTLTVAMSLLHHHGSAGKMSRHSNSCWIHSLDRIAYVALNPYLHSMMVRTSFILRCSSK
jgi:hypothetical protein